MGERTSSPFGLHLAIVQPDDYQFWTKMSSDVQDGTVGALLPNEFDSYCRISAPTSDGVNWWDQYRTLFGRVCDGVQIGNSITHDVRFGLWEGHGFENFHTPQLRTRNRKYLVFKGNLFDFHFLRNPLTGDWINPDLIWSVDKSWAIATDVDFWSLYIGGSNLLISNLCHQFQTCASEVSLNDWLVLET